MQISCPTCNASIEQNSSPVRGPTNDGSDAWVCLKCPAVVCVWCYHEHTAAKHPEAYHKKPTEDGKKRRKK
jgi:hypothetical protein